MKTISILILLLFGSVSSRGQVGPQFDPGQAPSVPGQLMNQSLNAAQWRMDQEQRRKLEAAQTQLIQQQTQLQQAQADRERQLFEIQRQASEAKARADEAQAKMERDLRVRAVVDAPIALEEFLCIIGESNTDGGANNLALDENGKPDYRTRYPALATLEAKYAYLKQLPEWQPLIQQIGEAKKEAHKMARIWAASHAKSQGTVRPEAAPSTTTDAYADIAIPIGAAPRDATSKAETKQSYVGVGGGHWIDDNSSDGSMLKLEDGSLWAIEPEDQIDVTLWLQTTAVIVRRSNDGSPGFDYLLINSDDTEKAHAKFLGTQ